MTLKYTEEEMVKVREERDEMFGCAQDMEKAMRIYALNAEREAVATKFANEQLFKMRADRDRWKQLRMDALDALMFWQAELARMWTSHAAKHVGGWGILGGRAIQFEALANKLAAKQGRNKPAVLNG